MFHTSESSLHPAQAPVTGVPGGGCGAIAGGPPVGGAMGNVPNSPTLPVPPPFVYALGRVEPRFPRLGVEKEFAQATGRTGTAGLTDREALYTVLSKPENRYLSRQLCWVFTVEGLETYLLHPTCFGDFNLLVEAVRPGPRPTDVDVVIGTLGPLAPPDMCNGLMVPIVTFDQIYSFDIDSLIATMPRPEKNQERRKIRGRRRGTVLADYADGRQCRGHGRTPGLELSGGALSRVSSTPSPRPSAAMLR